MVTNTKSNLSAFANKEGIKTEMLAIILELYSSKGLKLGDKAKEFISIRTEQLIDYYDVTTQVKVKRFRLNNNELSAPCVELSEFERVFEEFRNKISQIFLQLVLHDLGRFIEDNITEEK